jgi:energy-coupling factor transporter transmembrane protein EcfT
VSVILGLQVEALGVVAETYLSGVTELPFGMFLLLMQPIHLAIGLVEGIVTAAVLIFVYNARPELVTSTVREKSLAKNFSTQKVIAALLVLTALVGGGLSLFASAYPDGLEWSMEGVAGKAELERDDPIHNAMGGVVEATAFMPDYSFSGGEEGSLLGTATAGIVGSVITLRNPRLYCDGFVFRVTERKRACGVFLLSGATDAVVRYSKRLMFALPFALMGGIGNLIWMRGAAFTLGDIAISYGMVSFVAITLKTLLSVFAVLILIATTSFVEVVYQLGRLGMPSIVCLQFVILCCCSCKL